MTPTVLIPGLLCSAEVFAPQIPHLWRQGPVSVGWTLGGEDVAKVAHDVLGSAPPTFALCGISMGGYVCLEIMRQAPERVTRLALLDTSARPDTPEQTAQRHQMLAQAENGDFLDWATEALASILHPARRHDPAITTVNRRMAKAVGIDGFRRQTQVAISRPDSRPALAFIHVPTLVLVGDSDPLTPPDRSREMADAIPDSRLVVVEDCGHGSTLERPAEVTRALLEWIRG